MSSPITLSVLITSHKDGRKGSLSNQKRRVGGRGWTEGWSGIPKSGFESRLLHRNVNLGLRKVRRFDTGPAVMDKQKQGWKPPFRNPEPLPLPFCLAGGYLVGSMVWELQITKVGHLKAHTSSNYLHYNQPSRPALWEARRVVLTGTGCLGLTVEMLRETFTTEPPQGRARRAWPRTRAMRSSPHFLCLSCG